MFMLANVFVHVNMLHLLLVDDSKCHSSPVSQCCCYAQSLDCSSHYLLLCLQATVADAANNVGNFFGNLFGRRLQQSRDVTNAFSDASPYAQHSSAALTSSQRRRLRQSKLADINPVACPIVFLVAAGLTGDFKPKPHSLKANVLCTC